MVAAPEVVAVSAFLSDVEDPKVNLGTVLVVGAAVVALVVDAVLVPNVKVLAADPPSAGLLVSSEGVWSALGVLVLLKEKVGAEEVVEVEVVVAAVEVSGLRKLKALLSTFFTSEVGVVTGVAFVSDSVDFVKEKNGLEVAVLVTGGVLGAPNENPPIALGGSVFVGVDAGELAPKENPEVDTLIAGDAGVAELAPKENPVVEVVGTDEVAGAVVAAIPDDVLPNAKDVEDGAAGATDGGFVAEGVLVAAIPPNTFPLANVGLLRGEF